MTKKQLHFQDDLQSTEIEKLYRSYTHNKNDAIHNLFYAFMSDKTMEIQNFIFSIGCKDLLINENGLYLKKSDIFRSVCIDKIGYFLIQEENLYCMVEQNVFLDETSYHKPDITIFWGFDEETYDDYMDLNLQNPAPSVVVEVIDFEETSYIYSLIEVYKRIIYRNNDLLILFVDPIKKELFMLRKDINVTDEVSTNLLFYLHQMDFYKNVYFKKLCLHFENILSKQ